MKKKLILLPLLAICAVSTATPPVTVSYISLDEATISSNPIKIYPESQWASASAKSSMRLYPEIEFQKLAGLGGCFNEIGGEALASLDQAAQAEVIEALFGADKSAFQFCRASIGSSDFGIDAYSFSEVAGDYAMEHFSLDREKQYMLPYIQKAVKVNPDLKLFGSPWSPPAWMKYSGYIDQGSDFRDKNFLIDDPKIYEAYALYFQKYVEGYQEAGVTVNRILIQNEQDIHTKYPSCRMPVEQMAEFVAEYMRPRFEKNNIATEIWAGTFRTAGEHEGLRMAANSEYRKHFDGIGIQYTGAQHISEITALAPEMTIMHTESACHNGDNSWVQAKKRFAEVASYINYGSENFAYWNMILNETGNSGWGWRQNALITIDRQNKKVTYNPDYSVMTLMSRAIRSGDVRIAAYSRIPVITVSTADGYSIIMQNDSDKATAINCVIGDESVDFTIPARSLCAVKIN
ncbi:MAG: hypothetical protein SNG38_06975 [Rikenellaceae bacterium]